MNLAPRFRAKVENGKLKVANVRMFEKWLRTLKGEVDLIVRKRRKDRTIPQNRLYWLYVTIIAEELGYYPEELHCTYKSMFLVDRSGPLPIVQSTTRLNTIEFSEYLESVVRNAAELGIVLPDPESVA